MRKNLTLTLSLACTAVAIVLMALPISVILTFALGPSERINKTFSYFDISVMGMSGQMFPFLTAVISVISLFFILLLLLSHNYPRKLITPSRVFSVLCSISSILSVIFMGNTSIAGIIIAVSLLLSTVFQVKSEPNYNAY